MQMHDFSISIHEAELHLQGTQAELGYQQTTHPIHHTSRSHDPETMKVPLSETASLIPTYKLERIYFHSLSRAGTGGG